MPFQHHTGHRGQQVHTLMKWNILSSLLLVLHPSMTISIQRPETITRKESKIETAGTKYRQPHRTPSTMVESDRQEEGLEREKTKRHYRTQAVIELPSTAIRRPSRPSANDIPNLSKSKELKEPSRKLTSRRPDEQMEIRPIERHHANDGRTSRLAVRRINDDEKIHRTTHHDNTYANIMTNTRPNQFYDDGVVDPNRIKAPKSSEKPQRSNSRFVHVVGSEIDPEQRQRKPDAFNKIPGNEQKKVMETRHRNRPTEFSEIDMSTEIRLDRTRRRGSEYATIKQQKTEDVTHSEKDKARRIKTPDEERPITSKSERSRTDRVTDTSTHRRNDYSEYIENDTITDGRTQYKRQNSAGRSEKRRPPAENPGFYSEDNANNTKRTVKTTDDERHIISRKAVIENRNEIPNEKRHKSVTENRIPDGKIRRRNQDTEYSEIDIAHQRRNVEKSHRTVDHMLTEDDDTRTIKKLKYERTKSKTWPLEKSQTFDGPEEDARPSIKTGIKSRKPRSNENENISNSKESHEKHKPSRHGVRVKTDYDEEFDMSWYQNWGHIEEKADRKTRNGAKIARKRIDNVVDVDKEKKQAPHKSNEQRIDDDKRLKRKLKERRNDDTSKLNKKSKQPLTPENDKEDIGREHRQRSEMDFNQTAIHMTPTMKRDTATIGPPKTLKKENLSKLSEHGVTNLTDNSTGYVRKTKRETSHDRRDADIRAMPPPPRPTEINARGLTKTVNPFLRRTYNLEQSAENHLKSKSSRYQVPLNMDNERGRTRGESDGREEGLNEIYEKQRNMKPRSRREDQPPVDKDTDTQNHRDAKALPNTTPARHGNAQYLKSKGDRNADDLPERQTTHQRRGISEPPLPSHRLRAKTVIDVRAKDDTSNVTCGVCLDDIIKSEGRRNGLRQLERLHCRHFFHIGCIAYWFEPRDEQIQDKSSKYPTCPLCKQRPPADYLFDVRRRRNKLVKHMSRSGYHFSDDDFRLISNVPIQYKSSKKSKGKIKSKG